jgi:hypothetical protein
VLFLGRLWAPQQLGEGAAPVDEEEDRGEREQSKL